MKAVNWKLAMAVLVALAQTGFLSWMIAGRAAVLRDGAEVRLRVGPVDPRDLLRGDYVRLAYDVSMLDLALFAPEAGGGAIEQGSTVCAILRPGADGIWTAVSAHAGGPATVAGRQAEVEICGTAEHDAGSSSTALSVRYGIERYYVPEGEGRAIEGALGDRSFSVLAAVGRGGKPQIKALYEGDEPLYEEPLY